MATIDYISFHNAAVLKILLNSNYPLLYISHFVMD